MSGFLDACPKQERDPTRDTLADLATPDRKVWEDWQLAGNPPTGRFLGWLRSRFTEAELPRIVSKLERCISYPEALAVIRRALEPKLRNFLARRVR
jgi:hypothetical protein